MRIIDTEITKEILSGDNHPQLKIGDEMFVVDDRQSTFEKIQEVQEKETNEKEKTTKIFELALGKEATKKIQRYDLPVENHIYLTYCIMGAITGEDPKELQKMAKERKN